MNNNITTITTLYKTPSDKLKISINIIHLNLKYLNKKEV